MFSQSSVVNDVSVCLRRNSISRFSKDTGALGLNHRLSDFDKQTSSMIKVAYDYIGELNLSRSHRPDFYNNVKERSIKGVLIGYIRKQAHKKAFDDSANFLILKLKRCKS